MYINDVSTHMTVLIYSVTIQSYISYNTYGYDHQLHAYCVSFRRFLEQTMLIRHPERGQTIPSVLAWRLQHKTTHFTTRSMMPPMIYHYI